MEDSLSMRLLTLNPFPESLIIGKIIFLGSSSTNYFKYILKIEFKTRLPYFKVTENISRH